MTCKNCRGIIITRLKAALTLIVLTIWLISPAFGQTTQDASGPVSASSVQFSLDVNSHAGTYTYVPGEWGELHFGLENGNDAAQDLLCTTYFDQSPTLQFGRQVWLPGRSRLKISHPILFPEADQLEDRSASVRSLVIEASPGKEILVRNDSGQLHHERSLPVTPLGRNTGVIVGWKSSDTVPQDVLDLVVASRDFQKLDNKVTLLADQFLPSNESSLNYLDQLILAENRIVDDFAALTAVRRWLHAGGRLWIMLDRTDPVVLDRLFGDEFHGSVVDKVGLSTVRVDRPPSVFAPDGIAGSTIEYENPVNMTRMVVSGVDVRNTVNGWPAAMTWTYGRGRVLLTTLGPRGWMELAPPPVIPSKPKEGAPPARQRSKFDILPPMTEPASWVFGERETEALPQEVLESFAKEYVSYSVPTWTSIIGIMFGFLAALIATGIWCWKRAIPESFGWSGSLLAVLFGVLFIGIGVANRYGVPDTISSVYFARAIAGSDDVRADGVMAVYRPGGGDALIQSTRTGELWPDMTGSEGATRRMVTTDLDAFRWDNLSQPAGLGIYSATTSGTYPDRMIASATIDAQGIVGKYTGRAADGTDVILATREGRLGVGLTANGEFTANAESVLEPDQYLNATLLNDVQDRRRRILQRLFENHSWLQSLESPQLMLWLNDWDHGFQFGEGLQQQGDTLLMVPLKLSRPPVGTEMMIPSPLLSFTNCRPPDGSPAAGFWEDGPRKWQERSRPGTTWLSVQIPHELLPLIASQAHLEVDVSGAMGQIEILGVKNGSVTTLDSVIDPVGSLSFEIDDPDVLSVSDKGELTLGVRAGVATQAGEQQPSEESPKTSEDLRATTPANYWRIESLSVRLQARASELPEED